MGKPTRMESALLTWSGRKSIVWGVIVVAAVTLLIIMANVNGVPQLAPKGKLTLEAIPFDGARAYKHLRAICAIGPRIAGTEGMRDQQELVRKHFEGLGAKVRLQEF